MTDAPHPRRWWILPVLCLSLFLVVVDNTIVNVALPTMARTLGAGTSQLQWIVDAYSLVFAGLLLLAGSLGDRYGRKGVLQVGLVWFGLTSVAASLSHTPGQLIAARAAMGLGSALVFPATLAILTNVFTEPTERAKAIGIWSAVTGLAVALGPITGGALLAHFSWGSIFLVNLPLVVLALVAGHILIPTSRDPVVRRLDVPGVVLSIAAVTLLVFTIIEAPGRGWLSPDTVAGFAGAVVLAAVFVRRERTTPEPMLDVTLFRNLRFSAASLSVAAAFFCLFGFIFVVTQYFQFARGYSACSAGLHTLPFAVAAGVMAPLGARLALVVGTKLVVAGGLASMAVGFLVASFLDTGSSYWGAVVPSMVLMGAGLTLTTAPATEAVMGALPPERAGVGAAVNDTTRELGGTLGVAVVGSVFASAFGPRMAAALHHFPVPAPAAAAARSSVAAATAVVAHFPRALQPTVTAGLHDAFTAGMTVGSRVAAAVAVAGALLALRFLPARAPHAPAVGPVAAGPGPACGPVLSPSV
jgi:EmrB/QacA subfamily drug resistance transporter